MGAMVLATQQHIVSDNRGLEKSKTIINCGCTVTSASAVQKMMTINWESAWNKDNNQPAFCACAVVADWHYKQ